MNGDLLEGLEETLAILSDSKEVAVFTLSATEAAAGDVVPLEEVVPRLDPAIVVGREASHGAD